MRTFYVVSGNWVDQDKKTQVLRVSSFVIVDTNESLYGAVQHAMSRSSSERRKLDWDPEAGGDVVAYPKTGTLNADVITRKRTVKNNGKLLINGEAIDASFFKALPVNSAKQDSEGENDPQSFANSSTIGNQTRDSLRTLIPGDGGPTTAGDTPPQMGTMFAQTPTGETVEIQKAHEELLRAEGAIV